MNTISGFVPMFLQLLAHRLWNVGILVTASRFLLLGKTTLCSSILFRDIISLKCSIDMGFANRNRRELRPTR